jgi:hypothetical protein
MTTTIDKPKKHISTITSEYRPFWQKLFEHMGVSTPVFGAKLCYLGKEFSNDGTRIPCVRFFPNELNTGQDYYTELFDWDQNRYDAGNRTLYRLPFNPNWQKEIDKYVEVTSDKLPTSTYAIKLSDLELVNQTNAKALYPDIVIAKSPVVEETKSFDPFEEFEHEEMYSEKDDNHYSSMTIRDLYCVMQNVPLSNKKWLNQLIEKGKQWQQQK